MEPLQSKQKRHPYSYRSVYICMVQIWHHSTNMFVHQSFQKNTEAR